MKPRCKTRIVLTVIGLLPAMIHVVRPELSFDPLAMILTIMIGIGWLMVFLRSVRARWESRQPQARRAFDPASFAGKLLSRCAIYK